MGVYVADAPCGSGKTTAAIDMINKSGQNDRFLFITPFLKEVVRIKEECSEKNFLEPQERGTKLNSIHWLIKNRKNIVSTHALFLNFNDYTIELLKQKDYILVLDEVIDLVDIMDVSEKDLESILDRYAHVEDGFLIWDDLDYKGKFDDVMRVALNKCVGIYENYKLIWCFPIEIFKIFREVHILTYMFKSQIQYYYYKLYDVECIDRYVKDYKFTDEKQNYLSIIGKYKDLIDICDNSKLNSIGDREYALSATWFWRDHFNGSPLMKVLKNNLGNYFKHIMGTPSKLNMWTSFKDYKSRLGGNGYTRGFVSVNARATNDYGHKTSLAYVANIFMNPIVKNYFRINGIEIDEKKYALSEMIQWVWRSAIRNEQEISIYVPSKRMRELLIGWLENESI